MHRFVWIGNNSATLVGRTFPIEFVAISLRLVFDSVKGVKMYRPVISCHGPVRMPYVCFTYEEVYAFEVFL